MMGMGDVNVDMISSSNPMRQESLIAAHNLLRELESNDSLPDDMKKVLADLDSKLSAMHIDLERSSSGSELLKEAKEVNDAKERLKYVEEKIMVWESNHDVIWESGPEMASEYIQAVEEVVELAELFRRMCVDGDDNIAKAEEVLQVAMARLEEELVHVLGHRRQAYSPSEVEEEDDEQEGDGRATWVQQIDDDFNLIDPEAVPFLKSIRKTMFNAKYDQEFCSAYVKTQKDALEDCLIGLGMETVSIDEMVKMDWNVMASKIKTWNQVLRTAVQVYFLAEKRLCDEVLGRSEELPGSVCLTNITKSSMTCLFNFGHAMALGPHTPEKLFYLLDMYEVLVEVKGQIDALFSNEGGSYVKTEFEQVMERLGDSARATFLGFGDVILSDPTADPFPGGGVHPLSSYVMNYIIVYLPDYCETLNTLLQKKDGDNINVTMNQAAPEKSLLASHLRSIAANLKSNLEKKSQLYKDTALQHVFLMNNTHYMQQKVINSELRKIFGDEWIRTQIVQYTQHATSYVRSTWSSVVASLRDDGISSGSGSGVKAILKEKIRVFSVAFEDVYRNQTGWFIRDEQLKEELRISISQKVILAYQSFIGRHSKYDIEKYVKYDSDDLENLLRDFFEGSQKSLNYRRR